MRWKWILGVIAFLTLALLITIYIVLSSYNFNKLKPLITQAAKDATGRELILGGDIDLKIGFSPALSVEDVSFQNAPWGSRSELARLKRLEVQISLLPLIGGNIKIKRLILIEPDILIERGKGGKLNIEFDLQEKIAAAVPEEESVEEEIKLPALTFNKLLIEKGRITYRDDRTGKTYAVKLDRLAANRKDIRGSLEMELRGDYNGEHFEVYGTLGPLASLSDPDKAWSLNLTAEIVGVNLNIAGTIKDPLKQRGIKIGFKVKAKDLSRFEKLAGKPLPLKGPLEISGSVSDPAPMTYKVSDFKIAFGESDIGGSAEVRLAYKKPGFKATLSSPKLDLRPVLVKEEGKAEKAPTREKKSDRVFSSKPLPLDTLKKVNGSVKIKIKKLLLPQLAINNLKGHPTLNDGHLILKSLKATVGGGAMEGHLDLQLKGRSATMVAALKIDQIDLGNMLKELDITDILEGKLDVDVDLKSSGSSVAEMMANLDGNITLIMGKGQVFNKYINLLGTDIRASVFRLINPIGQDEDFMNINCFVSRFDIKDGLADSTALVFDSSHMSVVGEGTVNLKTEKLNLSLKPLPKEGLGIEGVGKLSLSLGELAKPFKLGGTLGNPSLKIDPLQTALIVGKIAGGVALFGPVGIASALVSTKSGDENPCLTAIVAGKTGVKAPVKKGIAGEATEEIMEEIKGIGEGLKKLLGK